MATGLSQPSPSVNRPPRALTWIIGVIALLFIAAPVAVGFYTDWLWFGAVDFRGVFTKVLVARILLFIIFALVAGLIIWLAGYFTWKNRPDTLEHMDLNSPVHQYRQALDKSVRVLLVGVPFVVALLAGFIGQSTWRTVMMLLNSESFGIDDATFGNDLGFYAFQLPALRLFIDTLAMLLVLAFLIALVGHYLLGSIKIGNKSMGVVGYVAAPARIQLAVTAGLWMLLQVATYWLDRYDLLYQDQGTFTGAGFTDINAVLPAKIILMVIAVFVAMAFFSAIVLKDLRIPALAVVLMLLSSFVIGFAWPQLMERFSVQPNRAAKESEFISRNIEATREAYGLTDDDVTYLEDWSDDGATDDEVAADEATISNIRLLDPEILSPTFTQMQQLSNFYGFPETLAVDRYEVDGELRDFVVAARELDPNALQDNQQDWINRHTVFTHGNGFVAAQANTVDEAASDAGSTRGGFPVFTVSDLQSNAIAAENDDAEELGIKVDQPRIYFGPVIASATDGADYSIVGDNGTGPVEYDTDTSSFTYDGSGGVDIGNAFNRMAFALRYQEINLILSDRVGGDSEILFDRDPRERVEKVAPWLTTDSKTYPAVIDGSIKWIVDGYTTLSGLPYSEQTSLTATTQDALNPDGTTQRLISDEVGYIRNSVKATVDAYDGTVELYEFDTEDPVLKVWEGIFPDTVNPESEISDELREHLRYPEDMFKVQRELLARYHVSDPSVFFTNDAFWSVPGDPTAPEGLQELAQPPYYVVAANPETNESSFQLITPYRGLNREFLSAHMAASSDPDNYGDITVRVLPTNTQTLGPKQAQDAMMSSDQVAADRTLWSGTNDLQNGNLLTLPVGGGEILYVEPIYSQRKDQESAFPKLLRVLVSYKGRVGYAPTTSEALSQVGIDPRAAQDIAETSTGDDDFEVDTEADIPEEDVNEETVDEVSGTEAEALERISEALQGIETAKDGSFEDYGRALDELDAAVAEFQSF
ncbi:UPF0182 family protein [Corynebacterium alimapuense]|uniref:UPF0182 protein C5L39_05255 n=1 Tax=Corynebacterium alimapuense TaxID=1576874 RepID=A0A3M8K837_9CORY|nr:UPF0182 family protein [Corynebacterium alimapuense]RNE48722.1 membrane protein [Corynebacterium alimapuense]